MKTSLLWLICLAPAPAAFAQHAAISGSVVDLSGAFVSGAEVKLSLEGRGPDRETRSSAAGEFSFSGLASGPYRLSFSAAGFAPKTISGELHPDEILSLPPAALAVDTLNTQVSVTQSQTELAEAQIKIEEQQRVFGILPDFYTSYDHDAAPLNAKQKLELTSKAWFDPSAFAITGIAAGVGQATNSQKGFGQGAEGFAKRYGAGFANFGTRLIVDRLALPVLFRQDPRYFYRGTGSKASRIRYAISRTFICRGDNQHDQLCYSSLIGRFGVDFATNYYYPAADRDRSRAVLRDSGIGIGIEAVRNIFQELIARKITTHAKH